MAAGNTFSINVAGADLAADADFTVDASSARPTRRGNAGTAADTRELHGRRDRDGATLTLTSASPPTTSSTRRKPPARWRSPARSAATPNVGDTVTLTVNGTAYTGAVSAARPSRSTSPARDLAADADLTVDAASATTDAAGNVGTATDTEGYTVDVTAPAPTVTLTSNITADDVINAAEAGGIVAITGTVGGDAAAGDTVTLTDQRRHLHRQRSLRATPSRSTCRARTCSPTPTSPSRRA